jgi:hypothetical protein
MKQFTALLLTVSALSASGCASEAFPQEPEMSVDALTASAAARKAIRAAVPIFIGGDVKRARVITIADAPRSAASGLGKAYLEMQRTINESGSFSASDTEQSVYEIFKNPKSRVVVGYAIWFYGDNGSSGRGLLRGFDLKGKQLLSDENEWVAD